MKKEFCTYEQSISLKELGFDESTLGYYLDNELKETLSVDIEFIKTVNFDSEAISAPLIQQAFRFFREKYKFTYEIKRIDNLNDNEHKFIESYYCRVENFDFGFDIGEYNTYEEAEQACLEKLIELATAQRKQEQYIALTDLMKADEADGLYDLDI